MYVDELLGRAGGPTPTPSRMVELLRAGPRITPSDSSKVYTEPGPGTLHGQPQAWYVQRVVGSLR